MKRTIAGLIVVVGLAGFVIGCGGDDDNGDDASETPTRPPVTRTAATSPTADEGSPTADAGSATVAATNTSAPATQAPASPTAAGGGDTSVTVIATDFAFNPATVTGAVGSTLTIEMQNNGAAPHTFTVYQDAAYTTAVAGGDTGNISGGATGSASFELAQAQYFFRCTIHPTLMEGTITAN